MNTKQFDKIINKTIDNCKNVLCSKAKEYATEDRLHNFKIAATLQGITPLQALQGMATKHTVSIADMIASGQAYSSEMWDEKIGDSINYLLLLRALVEDAGFTV